MAERIKLWHRILWNSFIALLSSLIAFTGMARTKKNDPGAGKARAYNLHWLRVENDTDRDLLADPEEEELRTDPLDPDMNMNLRPDGPEIGRMYHDEIDALPVWEPGDPVPNEIYRIDSLVWGTETCEVCGEIVNMGFTTIVNPHDDSETDLHFISLHYLRHGSFSYSGDIHAGRIDVARLAEVMENAHLLPVEPDSDEDLLADAEEEELGTDPSDRDEDGNWIADGIDISQALHAEIEALPEGPLPDRIYKIFHYVYGMEQCGICGESVNMGTVEITDPLRELSYETPIITLHFMKHGGFSYSGTTHEGRADVAALADLLGLPPGF